MNLAHARGDPRMDNHAPMGHCLLVRLPDDSSAQRASTMRACAVVLVGLLALISAGCGKSESQKQADQYADSLCTSISGWQQQINNIVATLTPGSPKQVAQTKLEQAKTATTGLVSEIRALEVPTVDGATEAKQNVDQLVTSAQSTISTIEAGITQIKSFGTGPANVATVVVPIAAQLTTLVTEAKSTVSSLETVKGPFEKAVKNSDTCQALKPSQSQ
jgi:hypothetical protein